MLRAIWYFLCGADLKGTLKMDLARQIVLIVILTLILIAVVCCPISI